MRIVHSREHLTMDLKTASEDFKTATEELGRPVTHQEMADGCAVSVKRIQQALLVEGSEGYRPPPQFWKGDLAYLARERAAKLVELADELEASAWAPATEEELEEIGSMILTQFDQITQPADRSADTEERPEEIEKRIADTEERREEIKKRIAEAEERREEIERRIAERAKRREEELSELNAMFHRGRRKET